MRSTPVQPRLRPRALARRLAPALLAALVLAACAQEPDVVLYCALDQVHSEQLVRRFERETGLKVRAEFDVEAAKTVGLVTRIREESRSGRPRCDVFWNNEIAHTIALSNEGLLASYRSPSAEGIPARFRDPQDRWTGFAARARVFIVNTERVEDPSGLRGLRDFLDPRWREGSTMAVPLTGTTLTHVAALYAALGEEWARGWLEQMRSEGAVSFVQSNGQVMRLVREGQHAWGLTDTDDYNVARAQGYPVAAIFPDQLGEDPLGTLLIPNTVSILADAPHPEAARRLVDFILSKEVEAALAASDSAQIPLHPGVPPPPNLPPIDDLVVMEVDWQAVARELVARQDELRRMFLD